MALLWFDGFENYNSLSDINAVDVYTTVVADLSFGTTYGRRSSRGMGCNYGGYINTDLGANYETLIFGVAYRLNESGTPTYSLFNPLLGFYDSTDLQVGIFIVGDEIQARNGAGVLLGTTSGANIDLYIWKYIELKATINNSTGIVQVRVDEQLLLNLTNQDTQNTANAYANIVRFGNRTNDGLTCHYDDFYVCDNSGSKNNDFLGDIRVDVIRPDGVGTYSQFTPSAGSNYENVDDDPYPDDDSTYNESSTVGHKDSYNLGSLPSPPSGEEIFGVKSQVTIRKTDSGGARAKILTKAGSTEDLSDKISLSDSYTTHTKLFEVNPDDSADWEDADVNAMEVGVTIVAVTTTTT